MVLGAEILEMDHHSVERLEMERVQFHYLYGGDVQF